MEAIEKRRDPQGDAQVAAAKRFGRYKKEDGKMLREADFDEGCLATLDMLGHAWQQYCSWQQRGKDMQNMSPARFFYGPFQEDLRRNDCDVISELIELIEYGADDVERFSIILDGLQRMRVERYADGLFLSVLIGKGEGTSFRLQTGHLGLPLHLLMNIDGKEISVLGDIGTEIGASMRGGRITVKGDVGASVGSCMEGGLIIVHGDASRNAGSGMSGGELHIHGDAGDYSALGMKGGILRVAGDAGECLGRQMKGGEIHVGGEIKSIGEVEGGKIFLKGELVVDR